MPKSSWKEQKRRLTTMLRRSMTWKFSWRILRLSSNRRCKHWPRIEMSWQSILLRSSIKRYSISMKSRIGSFRFQNFRINSKPSFLTKKVRKMLDPTICNFSQTAKSFQAMRWGSPRTQSSKIFSLWSLNQKKKSTSRSVEKIRHSKNALKCFREKCLKL